MSGDLPESLRVVTSLAIAAGGPVGEAARRETGGRDQAQVGHPRADPAGQIGGDGSAEREAGEPQRGIPEKHAEEQLVEEVEVGGAGRLAGWGCRGAVARMIERVHREARGQRFDVADPVLPRSHAAVEEDHVGPAAAPVHRQGRRAIPGSEANGPGRALRPHDASRRPRGCAGP